MTTCRTTWIIRLLWTALFCARAFAADAIPGTSDLGKLESGSVESGFSMPAAPQFVPGSPPPPNNDRQKSQLAAKALGMAAASQQKIACLGMMQQALDEKNESHAAMMMMMAQQMCAQADQQMAAAMKNDEGRKQISQNDIPKMAELKTTPVTVGKDKIKEAQVPTITFDDGATKGSSTNNEIPVAPTVAIPDLNSQVFNKPTTPEDQKPPVDKFTQEPERFRTLEGIDKNTAKSEAGKGGTPGDLNGPGPAASLAGLAGLPAKGTSGERGVASTSEKGSSSEGESGGSGKKRGGVITAGTDGGGGSSSEKSGGGMDIQSLMEQMMGGPAAAGEAGGSLQFIELNSQSKEDPPPNVFEYASFRYHKLATEQGAVRRRKTNGIKVPARGTVAQASKVWTEPDQKIDTVHRSGE